jgi:hypothetical protein
MGDVIGIGTTSIVGTVKTCPYPLNLLNKTKLFIQSNSLFNVAYTSYNLGFTTTIGLEEGIIELIKTFPLIRLYNPYFNVLK